MNKQLLTILILDVLLWCAGLAHGHPQSRFKRSLDLDYDAPEEGLEEGTVSLFHPEDEEGDKKEAESPAHKTSSCNVESFSCDSGKKCISIKWLCDGVVDCDDSSDEQNCARRKVSDIHALSAKQIKEAQEALEGILDSKTDPLADKPPKRDNKKGTQNGCPKGFYSCDGGSRCLQLSSLCDDVPDCSDEMDERNCPISRSPQCPASRFRCDQDTKCIPLTWVCDKMSDCDDNLDEVNCPAVAGNSKPLALIAEEVALSAAQEAKRAAAAARDLMRTAELAAEKAQRAAAVAESRGRAMQ